MNGAADPPRDATDSLDRRTPKARIAITVAPKTAAGAALQRTGEPVTLGLPIPKGACADSRSLVLLDAAGVRCPLQARTLDRWSDGSVKWALLDFQADAGAAPATRYEVVVGEPSVPKSGLNGTVVTTFPTIRKSPQGDGVLVDTGVARFSVGRHGPFPFENVTVDDRPVIDSAQTSFVFADAAGDAMTLGVDRVHVEEDGPLRAVILCEATVSGARAVMPLRLTVRLHFYARSATVRVAVTLRNPAAAGHPGGLWTLGDTGSVYLRDVSLQVALVDDHGVSSACCSPEPGTVHEPFETPFELYQESSGGDHWASANHRNREGVVPHRLQGYRVRSGALDRRGRRASPVLSLSCGDRSIAVAMPDFWQNFPKAVEAADDRITLRLWPRQYPDIHELQGGEQKTHTFFVAFGRDRVTRVPLDWCRVPLLAHADPSWYCASGAVPYLIPTVNDPDHDYVALAQAAIDGGNTFERKREAIDEYGWRHFGDVYADHEAVFQFAGGPLISHYNNQYDAVAGFATRFLRSGDRRWWTLMDDLASHVADVDAYHTDADKAAYNHGLFWHTYHYVDAGTSTHRSYPRHPKVGGGGPSAEHNYPAGLLLHYFLTGNPISRETALELAQWVIDMDDGGQTVFRWIDRGATGLASMTGSPLYHGPGRGAANSIVALMTGHRAGGDARFLSKAEALIRRCVHPDDDLPERNLLDAERRWFYTVFLQALGKYLDYKAELGEIDGAYAYARASLLHYAAWMVDHEYPYLDRPEILEYPTETWAAQDMRKSDVFAFAAKHNTGDTRARFLERADYFFQASVSTLSGMPTRTLTRPVVLMLTNGLMHAGCSRTSDMPAPPSTGGAGMPQSFVPQKVRALKRARVIAAALTVLAIAAAAGLFYFLS